MEADDSCRRAKHLGPVLETNASGAVVREAWYFNDNFPWFGMLFCAPMVGLWYWCTDQYIVQRALGAKNETDARRGSIFAAFLKLFPVYLFIIPGLICFALAKSGKIAELAPMVGPDGHANTMVAQGAFPMLVQYLLPPGFAALSSRTAFCADGLACRCIQRLLHTFHGGYLPEVEAGGHRTPVVRVGRLQLLSW
jgi:Na+/proline symporter